VYRRDNTDRSLARSAWEKRASKEPSRTVRYDRAQLIQEVFPVEMCAVFLKGKLNTLLERFVSDDVRAAALCNGRFLRNSNAERTIALSPGKVPKVWQGLMNPDRRSVTVPPTSSGGWAHYLARWGDGRTNMKEVAVEYDVEATKSSGWSRNLKRAD